MKKLLFTIIGIGIVIISFFLAFNKKDNIAEPNLGTGETTVLFTPEAGFGRAGYNDTSCASWANMRSGACTDGGVVNLTGAQTVPYSVTSGSGFYSLRLIMSFDTSSIPDDATIIGVETDLWIGNQRQDNDGTGYMILEADPASDQTLTAEDFSSVLVDGDIATTTYHVNLLSNATSTLVWEPVAYSWINKTGSTSIAFVHGNDTNDSTPPDSTWDGKTMRLYDYPAIWPVLRVTYTTGGEEEATSTPIYITSISDSPDPVTVGEDVTFSIDYTGATGTKGFICKTDGISTSSLGCTGGTWVASSTDWNIANPNIMSTTTYEGNVGTNDYYAFICESESIVTCSTSTSGTFTVSETATTGSMIFKVAGGSGRVGYSDDSCASWANMRAGSCTNTAVLNTSGIQTTPYSTDTGTGFYCLRITLPFDTSALPDDITITSAEIQGYTRNNVGNDDSIYFSVVSVDQTDINALYQSDYLNFSFTDLGNIAYASIANNATSTITLNSTGIDLISLTGSTTLGLITSLDLADSPAPTGTNGIQFGLSNGTSPAYLYVEYSIGTSSPPEPEPTNSCTPPSSITDDWYIDLADNCNFTSDIYREGQINCYGTGDAFTVDGAYIRVYDVFNCPVNLKNDGIVNIVQDSELWQFAVVPDTQSQCESCVVDFTTQMDYLVDASSTRNLKFVIQLGDIVDDGEVSGQWSNADTAFTKIQASDLPFMVTLGNHDYDDDGKGASYNRTSTQYESLVPESNYTGKDWYGDTYEAGEMENAYYTFTEGGEDWLVIGMEMCPREAVLEWASSTMQSVSHDYAIIFTHSYLNGDGEFTTESTQDHCSLYSFCDNDDCNTGEEMYDKFVKYFPEIALVQSGHRINPAWAKRVDTVSGQPINGNLANSQQGTCTDDLNTYIRFYEVNPLAGTMSATTYTPVIDFASTTEVMQFTIDYK